MKLFAVSDIHSFWTPLKKALDEAGFDPENKEHYLIVCGDCFDRGPESIEVLHYLMQLERKILIKGNHDSLLVDLCNRGFPYSYDKSNGTVRTVADFGGSSLQSDFLNCCQVTMDKTAAYRDLLVNYFETENYIFVHSWIPTTKRENHNPADKWIPLTTNEYMEDWRNANEVEWEDAMWGNPFDLAEQGLNKTGKILIAGHWHCSTGWAKKEGRSEFGEDAKWDIYHDEKNNFISIDKCTAYTGACNILVLEDNFVEND